MKFTTYLRRLRQSWKQGRSVPQRQKSRRRPELEHLEDRLAPVIGALAVAPPVAPGTGFDGVVGLDLNLDSTVASIDTECSGSLLSSGRHILTAAHCIPAGATRVVFQLPGKNILMDVPAANYWVHPGYVSATAGNDIAILRLPSLAPSGPVGVGAERYPIQQTTDEINQTFRVVGFGRTGTGATGNAIAGGTVKRSGQNIWTANANVLRNEVQAVTRLGNPIAGFFTLTFNGQTTGALPFNATNVQVQNALLALANIPAGAVNVEGGPALNTPWFVSFRGAMANTNVSQLTANDNFLIGGSISVATRFQGAANAPFAGALTYDFDNGLARNDALGLLHGLSGLGLAANEASQSQGDSGGPAFIGNHVSGIVSYSLPVNPGTPPDIDGFDNNSFGELGVMTRVSSFAGLVNNQLNAPYALVLDMNFQHAGNNGGSDTIEVSRFGSYLLLRVNGQVVHSDLLTDITSVTIRGSNDLDRVTVAGDLAEFVTVQGGAGSDVLTVTGTVAADTMTVTSTQVTIGATTVSYSSVASVVIESEGGNDVVRVQSTAVGAPVTVNAGVGDDTILVGRPDNPITPWYTLDNLAAAVTVNGESGNDELDIRDIWLAGPGHTYGVSSAAVMRGTIQINYTSMLTLELTTRSQDDVITVTGTSAGTTTTVNAGAGNDTINVRATAATGPLTVNAGNGNDIIHVGSGGPPPAASTINALQGTLNVRGEGGSDTLHVNDQSLAHDPARSYTVTASSITRSGPPVAVAAINFVTLESVNLHPSSTVTVLSTLANVTTTIDGGPGNDFINVGDAANSLSQILGPLTVNGGGGTDMLRVNDQAGPALQEFIVTSTTVARSGAALITYSAVEGLSIRSADAGAAGFVMQSTAAGVPVTLIGSGFDYLVRWAGVSVFTVNGANAGTLSGFGLAGAVSYSGVANLVGGTDNDRFVFANGQGVSGYVDGGGDADTLDYTAYATDVVVNFSLYSATGAGYYVYQVENVLGGAGNDILVGDDAGNVLRGGPGRDLIIGGGWSYYLLPDTVDGGSGEDIVIAGYTLHDYDAVALAAILAEWTQATSYETRLSNVYYGIGCPALNEGWVFYNYATGGNTLIGGLDRDWFFGDPWVDSYVQDPDETFTWIY